MDDLVSRDWLLKHLFFEVDRELVRKAPKVCDDMEALHAIDMPREQKLVDGVPVIRCIECKHRGYSYECPLKHLVWTEAEGYYYVDKTMDDDYCSLGEKKGEVKEG